MSRCRDPVALVTGHHPVTACAIGRELGLLEDESEVVTGPQLKAAASEAEMVEMELPKWLWSTFISPGNGNMAFTDKSWGI